MAVVATDNSWTTKQWQCSRKQLREVVGVFTGPYHENEYLYRMGLSTCQKAQFAELAWRNSNQWYIAYVSVLHWQPDDRDAFPQPEDNKFIPISSCMSYMDVWVFSKGLGLSTKDQKGGSALLGWAPLKDKILCKFTNSEPTFSTFPME